MGFTKTEIAKASDQLVEELVIWGDADTISARIGQRLHAVADHVMLHVLSEGSQPGPLEVRAPSPAVQLSRAGLQPKSACRYHCGAS